MAQKWLLIGCVAAALGIAAGLLMLLAATPDIPPTSLSTARYAEPHRTTGPSTERSAQATAPEPPRATPRAKEPDKPHKEATKPAAVEVLTGDERKLDRPDGEYQIEPVNGNAVLKLVGRVRTLRIPLVDNAGRLDASGLEAREIIVTGPIDGQAIVKLNAPGGTVRFNGKVSGSATLEVNAPNGSVIFVEPSAAGVGREGSKIDGGAVVRITAKDVNFRGDLRGGARVEVTLTADGSLKFQEIGGGALLRYRKADARGAEPKITAGAVVEGGKVVKAE